MDTLLEKLRLVRESQENAMRAMQDLVNETKKSDTYTSLQAVSALAEGEEERLVNEIKEKALQQFAIDGNKHIHPKVEVKTFKTFKVVDAAHVRDWCFVNLPAALSTDFKKVEKYSKEFGVVPGTETDEVNRVQIAKEL
jgi:hypothetical protein